MSLAVLKLMNRNGAKVLKSSTQIFVRMMASAEDSCGKPPEPPKPKEPCPPKIEPTPDPLTPSSTCPRPPPCPPPPQCPPTVCPPFIDSNNPCNYCPPTYPEPGAFDLSRIKKWQCFFQEENGIPLYLKRGNFDAFIVQLLTVVLFVLIIQAHYVAYMMKMKP